jgi:hypothetical protein
MMEIRQAVSTDVETITQFNIALCRETEGRELDPVTVTHGVRRFVSYPGSALFILHIFFSMRGAAWDVEHDQSRRDNDGITMD